jgi:LPS export ABC transporter permease LptG
MGALMALLDRLVVRRWTGVFFPALVVLMCIYLGGDAAGGMWDLVQDKIPAGRMVLHYVLKIPTTFYLMVPIAALLATLLSLASLKRSNELGAFFFSGVSRLRIARPVLSCALAASLASLVVTERVEPFANRASREAIRLGSARERGGVSTLVGLRGIWLIQGERVIHIRSLENGGNVLISPTVLTFTSPAFNQLASRVDAPVGRWRGDGGGAGGRWVMEDAMERAFAGDVPVEVRGPATVSLDLGISPREFHKVRRKPEEMTRLELLDYVRRLRMAGLPSFRHAVRIHSSVAVSFMPLIFGLIALAVGFRMPVRGGVPLGTGISLLLVMFFWSLYSFTLSLGNTGALDPALAAWGMVVFFTVAGFAFLILARRVRLT